MTLTFSSSEPCGGVPIDMKLSSTENAKLSKVPFASA